MIELDLLRLVKTITPRKLTNLVKVELAFAISKIKKKSVVWGRPFILTVEPSSLCNLNCPLCAVGAKKLTRKQGRLTPEIYRQILEEIGPYLFEILLFNQGEPFLNPNLIEFIRLAKKQNIYTSISTNGHFLHDRAKLNELIDSRPDVLLISLDGATEATYEQYRWGGKFATVVRGIRQLQSLKKHKKSRQPAVFLQFLVMRQNEHEIPAFCKLAKNLNVDRVLFKSLQVENLRQGTEFLPRTNRFRRYQSRRDELRLKRHQKICCSRLWRSTVLLSDGRIVPCCFDKDSQYSAGTVSAGVMFKDIWQSPEYNQMRNRMLRESKIGTICLNCTEGVKIYH